MEPRREKLLKLSRISFATCNIDHRKIVQTLCNRVVTLKKKTCNRVHGDIEKAISGNIGNI